MNLRTSARAALLLAATTLATPAFAASSAADINGADPLSSNEMPATLRLEVLLDRAGASVGAIDGKMDAVTEAAIAAFETMQGMDSDGKLDEATWKALQDGKDAVGTYEITVEDVGFELTPETPESYADMAKMEKLGFHRYSEALAEKFHMDEDLLKALNPDADFSKAGTSILVAEPGGRSVAAVERIEVDKANGRLRGYSGDKLVFAAPATVGSEENPSPEGSMKVTAIAPNPNYTFNPENIEGSTTKEAVIVPPGANGPVGTMWIDLGKPTYGIHGTPYPSQVQSMQSNGCVRLTNWDAEALAEAVKPNETMVEFVQ